MRKMSKWVFAAILVICGTSVFTSCTTNDDNPVIDNLAEKLVGKWLYIECDGALVETDESSVTTFVMEGSALKAYTSQSNKDYDVWIQNLPTEVTMNGNKLTLTMHVGDRTSVEELTDIVVSGDDLRYTSKCTVLQNGEVIVTMEPQRLRCVKVHDDYSKSIFYGRWEGTVTSDEPGFTPISFCEEYLPDGTNIEYEYIDGQWVELETEYSEYFIDGNLMCTRWKYPGMEELRANAVLVSYVDGILTIKQKVAIDGHLYTETCTLTKKDN